MGETLDETLGETIFNPVSSRRGIPLHLNVTRGKGLVLRVPILLGVSVGTSSFGRVSKKFATSRYLPPERLQRDTYPPSARGRALGSTHTSHKI